MSFKSKTKEELAALCKANGIKGYSKLKKDEIIQKLKDANVKEDAAEPKPEAPKKKAKAEDAKPRVEKLDKKILKHLDPKNYKDALAEHKEDMTTAVVMSLVEDKLTAFIDDAEAKERQQFVDKYGSIKALVEYATLHPNFKIKAMSEEEVYKMLVLHIFLTNEKAKEALVKAFIKFHDKLHKPAAAKKAPAKSKPAKVTKVKQPVTAEDEDEDEDEEDEKEDEDDYNHSGEDDE